MIEKGSYAYDWLVKQRTEAGLSSFFSPEKTKLGDHFEEAMVFLEEAIREGALVWLYGDYDPDGMISTVLMEEFLLGQGLSVEVTIPKRTLGYGLSAEAVHRRGKAPSGGCLVVLDSGTNGQEALEEAIRQGWKILIVDHHPVQDASFFPREGVTLWNPHACGGSTETCTGMMVGFLLRGMAKRGYALGDRLEKRLLPMTSMTIVSDVVSLRGYPRIILRQGLEAMAHWDDPAWTVMKQGLFDSLSETSLAFGVNPILNATSRLGSPELAYRFLRGGSLQTWKKMQVMRKEVQTLVRAAMKMAEPLAKVQEDDPGLFLYLPNLHAGIVGIVAGRLAEKYQKPTVVLTRGAKKETVTGSGRSPAGGFSLVLADLQTYFHAGGHDKAIGLHGPLAEHKKTQALFMEGLWREQKAKRLPILEKVTADYVIDASKATEVFADLGRLRPFGEGNRSPKIGMKLSVVGAPMLYASGYGNAKEKHGFSLFLQPGTAEAVVNGDEVWGTFSGNPKDGFQFTVEGS